MTAQSTNWVLQGSTGSATFESLPAELIAKIIFHLPDLASLGSILQVSTAVSTLFARYGPEWFESLLFSGYTCPDTQLAICIIACIRSGGFPVKTFKEFQQRIVVHIMHHRTRYTDYRLQGCYVFDLVNAFCPTTLPQSTSTLRSLCLTACRISLLTQGCLNYYLKRFRKIRPVVNMTSRKTWKQRILECKTKTCSHFACGDTPYIKPFLVQDIGPPTWQEVQRVSRAAWRYQMIHDLRTLASVSRLDWPDQDIQQLFTMTPMQIWTSERIPGPPDPVEDPSEVWTEYWEYKSLDAYIECQDHQTAPLSWSLPSPDLTDWREIILCGSGVSWTREMERLTKLEFAPYVQYGMALWSTRRLSKYGLSSSPARRREIYWVLFHTTAWISILDEQTQRRRFCEMSSAAECDIWDVSETCNMWALWQDFEAYLRGLCTATSVSSDEGRLTKSMFGASQRAPLHEKMLT